MRIIKPSAEIISCTPDLEQLIEIAGRTCWKSEDRITPESAERFITDVCFKRHHESVMEHGAISVRIICDRGILAEITRHRIASYSVESSRYCNYSKDKFSNEITVIDPCFWDEDDDRRSMWANACIAAECAYFDLLDRDASPQEARSVLPTSSQD